MESKEKEKKEYVENYKELDRIKAEIESSKDFQEFVGLKSSILLGVKGVTDFLLFKLVKNLERIADSLGEDSVLEGIADELSLIKEYIERDKSLEVIGSELSSLRECLCSKEFLDAIKYRK